MRNAAGFPERSKDANVNSGSRSSLSLMPLLADVALPGIAPAQDIEGAASDNPKYGAGLIMMDGSILACIQRLPPKQTRCRSMRRMRNHRLAEAQAGSDYTYRTEGRGSCRFMCPSRAIGARRECRKGAP